MYNLRHIWTGEKKSFAIISKQLFPVLFLVRNELPLRGDWNVEENHELGLFQNLSNYNLEKDEYSKRCEEIMPSNAKYTFPMIQNKSIQIISDILRQSLVSEINDSSYCSLFADGTVRWFTESS